MATVLLIADIGGYTRYMAVNRVALTHAHYVVGRLLETVIDAARPWLKLSKLEGDAALFWADERELDPQRLPECVTGMREAFVRRRAIVDTDCICNCDACVDTRGLTLKFVAHLGEVAFQRVKRFTELAGIDVRSGLVLRFWLRNSESSSACRSSALPLRPAASNAFMVGP